ncbi:MAG TPA: hypothetical protein VME66_11045 [Candidatus Acidoferrales bacterium]|nr:hypothetical protein [Candidatus Acidoferrales bacterium]
MLKRPVPTLDHLVTMTDDVGMVQHAARDVPNRSTGYCTDDIARAFMVALRASEFERDRERAQRLAEVYLSFLHDAQLPDGTFHNFMGYDRHWLDDVGTPDSIGRAIWGLGFGMRYAPRESWRRLCGEMLDRALPNVPDLGHARAFAYAGLGLSHACIARGSTDRGIARALEGLIEEFKARHREHSDPQWDWFEPVMTYDNARLCEVLLRAGSALGDDAAVNLGMRTLRFYESIVFEHGMFVPIGNAGWYPRGGQRARYGQQPLEAASLVDVELFAETLDDALKLPGVRHAHLAEVALDWFSGRNTRNVDMVIGGGCRDGLEELGLNVNMGAESTLAYLSSAFALAERPRALRLSSA